MRSKVKRGHGRLALLTRNRTASALAWSLPAGPLHCRAFLAGSNSVCSMCYAGGGMFLLPNVQRAMARRARWWRDGRGMTADKVAALVQAIGKAPYVVVHVSGDFLDRWEVLAWQAVALLCPATRFWIRTRTWRLGSEWTEALRRLDTLPNVCVRLSHLSIYPTKGAAQITAPQIWHGGHLFESSAVAAQGTGCPKQEAGSCAAAGCRLCWSRPPDEYRARGHGFPVVYAQHNDAISRRRGRVDWQGYTRTMRPMLV